MNDSVIYQFDHGVAQVIINRPERKNALNSDVLNGLISIGEKIKGDSAVRAVVLSGAGNCFSSGMDVSQIADGSKPVSLPPRSHGITNVYQQAVWEWHELPVPVIAVVEGVSFGGAMQLACAADMRYVHPGARMSIMEIKWGLVPDMAGTQLWGQFVKQDLLRELSYTGEIFDGERAMEYGFATRLSDNPLRLALDTAKAIALKNPDAIRANKRLINQQNKVSDATGLLAESLEQDLISGAPNQREAVAATLEKRAPNFQ